MVAGAIYVQPARVVGVPRIHATTPPSINTEPGGVELRVPAYFTWFYLYQFTITSDYPI